MAAPPASLPLSGISALVVEPNEDERAFLVSTLTSAGLDVTIADDFASARARLECRPPMVLVTEIRLGYQNGLHLAHIARWMRRQTILVVTSRYRDPVLARDAETLGATFLQKPLTTGALLATLVRLPCGVAAAYDDLILDRWGSLED
jgi:DNA-binding response OmpR family regulator